MKRIVSLLLLLSFLFLSSGCYSYNETEALSIISAAAADKSETGWTLTVMTLDFNTPSAEDVGKPKLTSGTGETLAEASMEVEKTLGSKLYWSHCYAFFIGTKAAESGIQSVLDYLLLTNNARINLNILIAKNSEGADFLNETNKEGGIKNQGIIFQQTLIKNLKNSASPSFKAYQTVNAIGDGTGKFILPAIEKSEKDPGFRISNSAVFSGQVLQGFCDEADSDLIAILKNECESYVLSVVLSNGSRVSTELRKLKTKLMPVFENGTVRFTVTVTGDAVVKEQDGGTIHSEKLLKTLSSAVSKALEEKLARLISDFRQSYGADALSFGAVAYLKNPKAFKALKYDKSPLENAVFSIKVKITAKNYGTLSARHSDL